MSSQDEVSGRFRSLVVAAIVLMTATACSGGGDSATTGSTSAQSPGGTSATLSSTPSVGNEIKSTAGKVPEKFPDAVPLPVQAPLVAFSNTSGEAKTFDLTYTSTDLDTLVGDLKSRLSDAGFALSGEYNAKVKNVPSAGFLARSDDWVVNVGGTFANGQASVHVSVISA